MTGNMQTVKRSPSFSVTACTWIHLPVFRFLPQQINKLVCNCVLWQNNEVCPQSAGFWQCWCSFQQVTPRGWAVRWTHKAAGLWTTGRLSPMWTETCLKVGWFGGFLLSLDRIASFLWVSNELKMRRNKFRFVLKWNSVELNFLKV